MKKMILLCAAFISAIAASAQNDNAGAGIFVFTDKDGNVYDDGVTVVRNEIGYNDFDELQIVSGLYVKQTATDKDYSVGMEANLLTLPNGSMGACFPVSCLDLTSVGNVDLGKSRLSGTSSYDATTGLASIMTEWKPESETAYGQCQATLTLSTYTVEKTGTGFVTYEKHNLVGKSREITVIFVNQDPSAINGVENGKDATVLSRYNVAGQRITAPVKGINIVKLSDGRTVKVNIK